MYLIDTHSHLYGQEFSDDLPLVVERAKNAGVGAIILPNIDCASIPMLQDTANRYQSYCFPCMGLHPTSVKEDYAVELACIEKELGQNQYYGIGEIGIDLYWDKTFYPQQVEVFRHQLRLAKEHELPVVIHSRNSFDEVLSVVDQEIDPRLRGVFHSFSGSLQHYRHIMDYKTFYVGIGGVITFKNGGLAELVQQMRIDSILLETDSPYLAPHPYRGKRNESAHIALVAQKIAETLQISIDEVAEVTTQSAKQLFGI